MVYQTYLKDYMLPFVLELFFSYLYMQKQHRQEEKESKTL